MPYSQSESLSCDFAFTRSATVGRHLVQPAMLRKIADAFKVDDVTFGHWRDVAYVASVKRGVLFTVSVTGRGTLDYRVEARASELANSLVDLGFEREPHGHQQIFWDLVH